MGAVRRDQGGPGPSGDLNTFNQVEVRVLLLLPASHVEAWSHGNQAEEQHGVNAFCALRSHREGRLEAAGDSRESLDGRGGTRGGAQLAAANAPAQGGSHGRGERRWEGKCPRVGNYAKPRGLWTS